MEKVKILNSKGQNIAAVVDQSKIKTEKLAILCPGFLDTKDYSHLVELAKTLAGLGYTAVRFDPTGTWESEGEIADYTTSQYLSDVKSVLEYMLRESGYKHILLGGHSRGGMVSILYAARDPRISVVVGIMPSSPYTFTGKRREEWEKSGVSANSRDVPNTDKAIEFRVPFSHVTDREQYNVFEDVKKVRVPLILITGELDKVVLPEYVKMIFYNANEPKKFISIHGIGHDYRHHLSQVKMVNEEIMKNL
ncbi:MAG: alpha/beta fold hydrolase [bacterium]|nr:alpha/beta fold hydrolase [bacterium]